jgi:hypothetical protein
MIRFSIGGRTVEPRDLNDALMAAVLEGVRAQIMEKVGSIRDPETGEFPTVIVQGDRIGNLSLTVEGSPNLVALVKERLGLEGQEGANDAASCVSPRVFLSYTSDNLDQARRLAEALEASGIATWWDRWCIYPGDSLRQKIDEGIAGCTHFLVLLTPQSIKKPWVNQEMDAGLVHKLKDQCRFLPVRSGLPASDLPPLLSGMYSPAIEGDEDIAQLIRDIYGVSRRPPPGAPPPAVAASVDLNTNYSAAATTVARFFVERTEHGLPADPHLTVDELAKEIDLGVEDVEDALYELSRFVKVSVGGVVVVEGTMFAEFDRHWKPWDPAEDALRLGADIVNDPEFPADCEQIAQRYSWEPRRLNPAIHYLLERDLILDRRALGSGPWAIFGVIGNKKLRRFVKSRS